MLQAQAQCINENHMHLSDQEKRDCAKCTMALAGRWQDAQGDVAHRGALIQHM